MNSTQLLSAAVIGVGATLLIDLWAFVLRRAFAVPSLNYCLLGRWVLHMTHGQFAHERIAASPERSHECPVGWATHYSIGIVLAIVFVSIGSADWLARPTLPPALAFGVATVVMPFFTIQPAFGLGIASSKTPRPNAARFKSVMTHTIFGVGLWLWAIVLHKVVGIA